MYEETSDAILEDLEDIVAPTTKYGSGRGIAFGLIFFSSSEAPFSNDKYRLVIESTKFADQHDFSSVWIPERHFTKDGWLYPNPAVLQAALARETEQIQLRAGSVVLPLHNPLRVAEEWAMVDNLSGGRVGVSFASGWHPNDFALFPENYEQRSEIMYRSIEMVRKLWRGEAVQVKGGDGNQVEIRTYPPPIQREIPIWITAASNPKTFAGAGEIGANLLTHMYNQSVDELAEKIRTYRDARARSGYDPESGQVSVMLHTFIGKDQETVRAQLQGPFTEYLKSASYLVNAIAYSRGQKVDMNSLSEQDLNDYLLFVFDRLVSTQRVLFGTPESCQALVNQLKAAGVNEIACQMDFGVDSELVLESMPYLNQLKDLTNETSNALDYSTSLATESLSSSHQANGHASTIQDTTIQKNYIQEQQAQQDDRLESIQKRCQEQVSLPDFYQTLSDRGIQLAASFQGIEELWRRDGEALGRIKLSSALAQEADLYQIHPTLLDACFQVLIAALPQTTSDNAEALYLPTGMRSFQQYSHPGQQVWSHAKLLASQEKDSDSIAGDVRILNENGEVVAEAKELQLQRIDIGSQPTRHSALPTEPTPASELDKWLYELQWEQVQLTPENSVQASQSQRTWLLFMDNSGVGKLLAASLERRGDICLSVTPGYRYVAGGRDQKSYQVNPTQPEDIARILKDVEQHGSLYGVVYLWGLDIKTLEASDATTLEADQEILTGGALNLIQQLAKQGTGEATRLWIVTRGAQAVIENEEQLEVAQSPLWGLGKTCAIEHPEVWGGLIDLDPGTTRSEIGSQLSEGIASFQMEDQIAFRRGQSYVARMVRSRPLAPKELRIEPDASYLITGGLWGLGLEVAYWLTQKGARHLVLMGRTKLPPRVQWNQLSPESRQARQVAGILELERAGASVHYAVVDVTKEDQLASFFTEFQQSEHPPLRGVVHAASVWQDAQGQSLVRPLVNLTIEALMDVFRPKVIGSWLLYTQLKGQKLDFFVSFSSGASLFGSAAQGNYAAAGEFLDVLAHYQRAQGQPALSIDWGAVSGTGFGATSEGKRVHEYWEGHGIQRITPQQVLAALELLIPQKLARVGVLKLDWKLLQEFYPQITTLPLVRQLIDGKQKANVEANRATAGGSVILMTLMQAKSEERTQVLQDYLSEQVAGVLRMPSETLDSSQPLTALGLDSLMAIELKNRLELELAVRIPIVTFLQGPSIAQFTAQLLTQLQTKEEERKEAGEASEQQGQVPIVVNADSLSKQDATQLLSQLDQLSDQDVDALLNQIQGEAERKEHEGHRTNGQNGHTETHLDLSPQDAQALLAQLDQLSDEQVDALLGQMAQKEE